MLRFSSLVLGCVLAPALGVHAAESPARPLEEYHEVVRLEGNRVGTSHFAVVPTDAYGKSVRCTTTLDLTLRRFGSLVRLRREQGTIESLDGKVEGVFMRQGAPGGKQLVLAGSREGDRMVVKVDAGRLERRLTWSDEVLGSRAQQRLFKARKPVPGDRFQFLRYEPTYNAVLTVRVEVKDREMVEVLGTRRSLTRVELTPDRLEAPGTTIRPPRTIWWLDGSFVPIRREMEIEGLGTLVLTRTTREGALGGGVIAPVVDVGSRSLIPLDRAIPRPYDAKLVLYRVTVRDEDDPTSVLVQDDHQEIRNVRGNRFDLLVHPVRPGSDTAGNARPGPEYLASSHYIDHNDERIEQMTRKAVGSEKDDWKKAQRIERWVKNALRTDNAAPLVPASGVARSLRGDCRHHAFLTAAMCRSAGLPARTAIGLLYVTRGGPKLGFHTWVEVYLDGRWVGIDSTLGKGGVSATHLKISQHSWHDTASLTPLLPVNRVLGKLRVEVVRIEG